MIGISVSVLGQAAALAVRMPGDRKTDEALASQDQATETLSEGQEPDRLPQPGELRDPPSVLDRFRDDSNPVG